MFLNLSAILSLATASELPAVALDDPTTEPIRLWMNSNRTYRPGDRVQVQVETGVSGYLLVLHVSPDRRLKVLFPVEPGDDAFVRAGRRYEVRDPELAQSFFADGSGPGLAVAALAQEQWRLEAAVSGGAWNYGFLSIPGDSRDPEAEVVALIQRLSPPGGFDYDVLDYAVVGQRGRYATHRPPPRWWSPTYVQVQLDFYDLDFYDLDPWWSDRWWACWSCSRYVYWWAGYPPWWYSPWGWPYRPYRYTHYLYPWPYYPWSGGTVLPSPPGRVPAIVGRPRGYTVGELRPWTERARAPQGSLIAGGSRGVGAGVGGSELVESSPLTAPARRARPRTDAVPGSSGGAAVAGRGGESPGRAEPTGRPSVGSGIGSPPSARPPGSTSGGSQPSAPARSRPRGGRGGGDDAAATRTTAAPPVVASPPAQPRSRFPSRMIGETVRVPDRTARPGAEGAGLDARVPRAQASPPPVRSALPIASRAPQAVSTAVGNAGAAGTRSRARPRGN